MYNESTVLFNLGTAWQSIWVFALLFFAVLHLILCFKAAGIAKHKGHHHVGWFFLCFFTGICGFVLVAGLPDLVVQSQLEHLSSIYDRQRC